jgi:hypothetical protein
LKVVILLLAVFTAHYGYTAFGDGSRQANIDWFYAVGGFKSAVLFSIIGLAYYRNPLILGACAWGVFEELQVGACQVIALKLEKYPEVSAAQGVCGALVGMNLSIITSIFIIAIIAWAIQNAKFRRD